MIFDAKHEMIRKLVRQFAETELTTEVLDKVEETGAHGLLLSGCQS